MNAFGKPTADVAVIAANFNNGKFLDAFIESVRSSDMLPAELIIVDDGSTDNSLEILSQWEHLEYLTVICFNHNRGLTAALNAGLERAASTYIMRADPDDIFLPDRIRVQVDYLQEHPGIDILGSNVIYFSDTTGKDLNVSNFPADHASIVRRYRNGEHGIQHPTVCIRSLVFKQYRYQKIFPGEDYEIFSRMVLDGHRFANIKKPLYKMRIHGKSSTSNLSYDAIKQTFFFRDQLFGKRTPRLRKWSYFLHIRFYRKYQLSHCSITGYWFLFLSLLFCPVKLFRYLQKILLVKQ